MVTFEYIGAVRIYLIPRYVTFNVLDLAKWLNMDITHTFCTAAEKYFTIVVSTSFYTFNTRVCDISYIDYSEFIG